MIFVDTGAWISVFDSQDSHSDAGLNWFTENNEPLVTTDYVIDETLTLLRAHGRNQVARKACESLVSGDICQLVYVSEQGFLAACRCFDDYADKGWSLTDCSSKVIMDQMQISTAFAFDRHFRQFGTIRVVP